MSFQLPPLNFNAPATSGLDSRGSSLSASGPGDWVINMAGSGAAMQGAAGGVSPLMIVGALVVAVLWFKRS